VVTKTTWNMWQLQGNTNKSIVLISWALDLQLEIIEFGELNELNFLKIEAFKWLWNMRKKKLPKRLYINSVKIVRHLQNVQYKFRNHFLYNKTILSLCYDRCCLKMQWTISHRTQNPTQKWWNPSQGIANSKIKKRFLILLDLLPLYIYVKQ